MIYKGSSMRHEYKYSINYHEYQYLLARLGAVMPFDENSGEDGYHIRSLYFDDMYNSALNEKESGIQFRQKYRIRIYNKGDKIIKLERKEKYGDYISKQSFTITKDEFYAIINDGDLSFLLNAPKDMPRQMYWAIRTRRLSPVVNVDYHRNVLVCNEGNVRITFDKELQAGIDTPDMFDPGMTIINAMAPDLMVLEVKYDDYLPDYIKNALQITSHKREAVSKYVYCRLAQMRRNPAASIMFGGVL